MARKRHDLELRNMLSEEHDSDNFGYSLIFYDGHDNAICGVIERCGQKPFLVYDRGIVVDNLMKDGLSSFDAEEFLNFNWCQWVGEQTPALLGNVDDSGLGGCGCVCEDEGCDAFCV